MKKLLMFVVILLFTSIALPAYSQESGSINVIPPNEDCAVLIDGMNVGAGTTVVIKTGMHNVVVNSKDGTELFNKQVEVVAKETAIINVSYELQKDKNKDKIWEGPFDKEQTQQKKVKRLTIKGLYSLGPTIHKEAETSDYAGSGYKVKDTSDSNVDGGLGFGCEVEMFKVSDKVDIIAGFSYNLAKKVTHVSGKISSAGLGSATYRGDIDDAQVTLNSLYGKVRYMLSKSEGGSNPYLSAKLAYLIPSISGDNFDGYTVENGWGYGVSIGSILNDEWDIECCVDYISIPMKEDLYYFDGVDWYVDSLDGTYTAWLTSVSLGYKF